MKFLDIARGVVEFLEINLNCNLWSRKTISMAARLAGWTHEQLIETILCESLSRNGLLDLATSRSFAPHAFPVRPRGSPLQMAVSL